MFKIQTVFLSLVVLLVFHTAPSFQAGAGLNGECAVDSDCDPDKFLICNKGSTSCKKGVCKCKDLYTSESGVCTLNAYLGQTCDGNTNILTVNGECSSGTVACISNYTRIGNYLCGNSNTKVLGDKCNTTTSPPDQCYLHSDSLGRAVTSFTFCTRDYCGCPAGIWDNYFCRSRKLGDQCGSGSDCPTGAHCVSAVCTCVAGEREYRGECYTPTDYGLKAEGDVCNPSNKECALELVCKLCQENIVNRTYTCNQPPPYSGSPVRLSDVFVVFSTSLVTVSRHVF